MIGYFVTGTDTNVGKTYVTCALARLARQRGRKVLAFKPIETGCAMRDGHYVGADQQLLLEAAGSWQLGPLGGIYRFPVPAAPLVAAEAAGAAIDLPLVIHTLESSIHEHKPDVTLVEGAGGWRVPITRSADTSTLARDVGFQVLVVARAGLGTINHTLLTIEAITSDGLTVAAVVLSERPEDERASTLSNRDEISRRWSGRILILGSETAALDSLLHV